MRHALQQLVPLLRMSGSLCVALLAVSTASAFGQGAATPPPPPVSNPMYVEWGITAAMIGLAMFVVCRKSNRT